MTRYLVAIPCFIKTAKIGLLLSASASPLILNLHGVNAIDSLQQKNTDCGLYILCLHAFCYITDSYFFNTPSNDSWLFYKSKKYLIS